MTSWWRRWWWLSLWNRWKWEILISGHQQCLLAINWHPAAIKNVRVKFTRIEFNYEIIVHSPWTAFGSSCTRLFYFIQLWDGCEVEFFHLNTKSFFNYIFIVHQTIFVKKRTQWIYKSELLDELCWDILMHRL